MRSSGLRPQSKQLKTLFSHNRKSTTPAWSPALTDLPLASGGLTQVCPWASPQRFSMTTHQQSHQQREPGTSPGDHPDSIQRIQKVWNILDIGKALCFTFLSNHRPSLGFDQLKTMTSGPPLWPCLPLLCTAALNPKAVQACSSPPARNGTGQEHHCCFILKFQRQVAFLPKVMGPCMCKFQLPFLGINASFFSLWSCAPVMWDLSSPTRDGTCSPWVGSLESQPLDHQGSLNASLFDSSVSSEMRPTKLVQAAHVHECIHVCCVCLYMWLNYAPPGQEEPIFLGWLSVSTLA